MACYNAEKTLPKAIDSILLQTYTDWVLICCDDGSTDDTWEVLQQYRKQYPDKFVLIRNEENKKLPYSLNRCLKAVRSTYVARMDADDWSAPDRLEKQITFLKEHPEYDLVGTAMSLSNGIKEIGEVFRMEEPKPEDMKTSNCFNHATIMTYRKVYYDLKGYSLNPRVQRVEDLELWSRFFLKGYRGYNLQEKLYTVLEDENAVGRRNLAARKNSIYTHHLIYKRLGFKDPLLYIKPYVWVLKCFVPTPVYQAIRAKKYGNER